jgi:hypothetical protein
MSSEICRSASRRPIIVFGEAASLHASLTCVSSASSGRSSDDRFRRVRLRDGPKPSEPPCFLRRENGRPCQLFESVQKVTSETRSQLSRLANWAFSESRLTSIHLPASVSVIGEFCFCDCDSLASITFDPASKFRESTRDTLLPRELADSDATF